MIHEENGQIIVDELRPMSEAPINYPIIAKYKKNERMMSVCLSADSTLKNYEGWIPLPIYRPKDGA
mgnify:CR=1 FL=1